MNREFHYYITYLIAREAGFPNNDAYIIAYSSQYTDDNMFPYDIDPGMSHPYMNYISQTVDLRNKTGEELLDIYGVFHFLPGSPSELSCDPAERRDGQIHKLNTIPDSINARKVMDKAFSTGDLYRIGIATHVYADTFSHQNFVGTYDDFNSMNVPLPNIGHLDAQHNPDIINRQWIDCRLIPANRSIRNRDRFMAAASCIFDLYSAYLKTGNNKTTFQNALSNAANSDFEHQRIQEYIKLIGPSFVGYNENAWFEAAVDFQMVSSVPDSGMSPTVGMINIWKSNHTASDWFKFQEAVKAHRQYVLANILL